MLGGPLPPVAGGFCLISVKSKLELLIYFLKIMRKGQKTIIQKHYSFRQANMQFFYKESFFRTNLGAECIFKGNIFESIKDI